MKGGAREFEWGAGPYDLLTSHSLWLEQAGRLLEHAAGLDPGARVLDLGCGPGASSFALAERLGPDAAVVGIDLARRMVARAEAHRRRRVGHRARFGHLAQIRFLVADAGRLPFADGQFDLVTGHSFLYLVPDRGRVLSEVERVLAPGGRLVLMEPSRRGSLWRAGLGGERHARRFLAAPGSALRLAAAMVVWRAYSGRIGRLEPEEGRRLLTAAGFQGVGSAPTLRGLGVHLYGVKGTGGRAERAGDRTC